MLLYYIGRYSPTDLNVDLKKLLVVFQAKIFKINFKNLINKYSQDDLKTKNKLTGPTLLSLAQLSPHLFFFNFQFHGCS